MVEIDKDGDIESTDGEIGIGLHRFETAITS
jgi:hypothetical protein